MRGNQLFGIFSPEKLKKVIRPHRAPGVQGGAQMRGNQLFGIFSPEKLKKVIPPPGSRRPESPCREGARCGGISFSAFSQKGDSPAPGSRADAGNQLFGIFSPEKLKKVNQQKLKKVIRAPGIQRGAQMRESASPTPGHRAQGSREEPRC